MRGRHPLDQDDDWEPKPEAPVAVSGGRASALSLLALAALVGFHVLLMKSWVLREGRPPAWDQATHLEISLDCKRAIDAGEWRRILHFKPKPGMPPFPPLYHLSILYAHAYPDPARAALWANCFYMALLCLALWGLGRHFGGDWGGVTAALLFSCAPEIQWLYFNQLVDLAVVAWVAAAYWALLACAHFSRRIPSLLFGLALAAGLLTKWSAFSYFLPAAWVIGRVMGDRPRRINAFAALALTAALCAPWYASQGAVLLPRLVEASADNAVAVWRAGAVFMYLVQMAVGLGTPLWILGLISLFVPTASRRREDVSLPLLWTLSSYLFWSVVPNRQLRYLLPGLPPLAVMSSALWPRRLLAGLAAYQLLAAANYTFGRIPHMGANLILPISFFHSDVPRKEDWRIPEILKEAERRHDPASSIGNLTLVANHESFNGPTFNWIAGSLGLRAVRIRGVNRRLCEFSEFVLVKTGSLGPPSVVNQLPEVQGFMLGGKGWFSRAYREAARWPLPDGTEAVLFMRAKFSRPLFREQQAYFVHYEEPGFLAKGLSIDLGRWDSQRGVYPQVRVRAASVALRGLELSNVALEMEDLSLVPVKWEGRALGAATKDLLLDFRFLGMKRLRLLSGTVTEQSAAAFLRARVPGLEEARFRLDGTIAAAAAIRGVSVSAEVSAELAPDRRGLTLELKGARVFGLPVPAALFGALRRYTVDFRPNPELPFEVDVSGLRIRDGRLSVGGPAAP